MTNRTRARARARAKVGLVALAGAVLACGENNNQITTPTPSARTVVGVAELTFTDLNHTDIAAHLVLASSLATLQQLDAAHDTTGDVTVVSLGVLTTSEFAFTPTDSAPVRFIRATFGLRNAGSGSPLFVPAHDNLTFVEVTTPGTVPGTPVRLVLKADGTPADPTIAQQLVATDITAITADGTLTTLAPTVRVTLAGSVLSATPLPNGASQLLPAGFLVRGLADFPVLGPGASAFDGLVTFAFRLPTEALATNDASTLSLLFVLVNDPNASGPP